MKVSLVIITTKLKDTRENTKKNRRILIEYHENKSIRVSYLRSVSYFMK